MLLGMIIAILVLLEVSEIGIYSMSLSYYLLLPALLYLDKLFSKFEISIFLLFVLTLLIIIIFGSRGPLVALLSFFIIRIIRIDRSNKVSQIVYHSLIVLFSLILAINFRSILIKFNEFLNDFGIRSRTVTLFLSDALNTSGRDVIYRVALDRIAAQPFFGYGLTGDRVFIDRLYYAHNIFLEITLNFGLLIGIPIVMFVLYIILVSIFSYTDLRSNTVLIWFALSFVPLMFSGSWILDTNFWILLGFCLSSFLTLRRKILLD
jgi:O-antigen ligase